MDILGFLKKIWDPGRMSLRLTLPSIPAYGVSVKSMKFSLRLVLLVSFAGVFSGCTGGNFLIGKWTFDSDKTLEAIQSATTPEPDPENPAGGILKGIVGGLQKGLSMVVVSQMEGLDIEFTREEIRRVRKGAGESQGCRLDGGYSELVRALSEAVERCRTGGSIEPDPKSRSTTISNGLFNRKLSNLRLVFSHHSESGEIRFFCGEKSGEPVLLVIDDSRDSPADDLMVDRVLDVFEDGSLGGRSQSSYEWPLPAFTAAVAALRDAEEELKQKSN